MSDDTIRVSDTLALPAEDALESAIGIIGKRGRGKSGLVKVVMEELVRIGLPFVAFDPVGIMWGIRSSADGLGPGLPVLVVGGSHGDLPLDRAAGARTAKAIVDANCSAILDFSEEPKTVYREFIKDFAHELYRVNDTPRQVIVEEAPELVPQRLRPDMTPVFEAVERLVSRGRNKGLGVILVSQRAATINKDVLSQIDALFVMGLTAPQDRKALQEWVEGRADPAKEEEFFQAIAGLARQEAFFWSPEAFGSAFQRLRVRNFETFHPDKTHLRRSGMLSVRAVTADVAGVVRDLRAALTSSPAERPRVKVVARAMPAPNVSRDVIHRFLDLPTPPPPSTAPAEPVDVVLRSPRAEVKIERPIARVTVDEATPIGKVLVLLLEGYFATPRTQGNVRDEIRRRYGMDYNSNGGMWKTLRGALTQCLEPGWGFLITEGTRKTQTFAQSSSPRGRLFSEDPRE